VGKPVAARNPSAAWNGDCLITATARLAIVTSIRKNIFLTTLLGVTWVAAVAFGARILLKYESAPGRTGPVPAAWPVASAIERSADKSTLIMLAHPHCPCTRASVGELAQIMARAQGKTNAYVVFIKPSGAGPDWDDTDLRRTAATIPGVKVLTDANGTEADRFGIQTSGHTLLFDRSGALLFSGGITSSRGHAGGNTGESAILAALNGRRVDHTRTPIFGCALTKQPQQAEGIKCLN
jgi:hypothetical protein